MPESANWPAFRISDPPRQHGSINTLRCCIPSTSTPVPPMPCYDCCRPWTAEDAAADADEKIVKRDSFFRKEQEQAHKSSVSFEEKDTEGGRSTPLLAETPEGQKEEGEELPPTAEEIASATDIEAEVAPSSSGSGLLTLVDAGAVKRVNDDLTEGGLLLTQIMGGNRKAVRRLEVEENSGVLQWEVEALFGMRREKVKLSEARMMCTGNLVKIGIAGRKEFLSFEACDDNEAAAVCDALVGHAKRNKTKNL